VQYSNCSIHELLQIVAKNTEPQTTYSVIMVEESHRITNDILVEGIADVLGIKDKTRIQLEGFDVSEGSKKGDNFACVMKAVEAQARVDKGELQTFHFMAKGTPMNPMRAKWIHEGKIFDKECLVYSKLMPAFAKLQEQHKVLDKVAIPKCHYASLETEVQQQSLMFTYTSR
jgi:hypothetical protein